MAKRFQWRRLCPEQGGGDLPGSEATTGLAMAEQLLDPLCWFCSASPAQVKMQ